MGYWQQQWALGRQIYGYHSWREKRRIMLYTLRSYKNYKETKELVSYFDTYPYLPGLLNYQVGLHEVISRIFFYKDSTARERLNIMKEHFNQIGARFKQDILEQLYDPNNEKGVTLWENEELGLRSYLWYHAGQRKEGLLSLFLTLDGEGLYHVNFMFGKDLDNRDCIRIGTIQGYQGALDRTKKVTKKLFGYRPKNLIFFLVQQIARYFGIESIMAVSDYGFYTNTHLIRLNRHKLVTFNPFWEELGGHECVKDKRFFYVPVEEQRKTYETAKSQKRNQYRKRYELLDIIIADVAQRMSELLK